MLGGSAIAAPDHTVEPRLAPSRKMATVEMTVALFSNPVGSVPVAVRRSHSKSGSGGSVHRTSARDARAVCDPHRVDRVFGVGPSYSLHNHVVLLVVNVDVDV